MHDRCSLIPRLSPPNPPMLTNDTWKENYWEINLEVESKTVNLTLQYIWWPGKVKLCTMCEYEFTIHNSQSTIHNSQSTIHNPQSTFYNLQSTIYNTQSTIRNLQSRIYNSRYKLHKTWTTIDNLQSAIHNQSIRSDTMMIYACTNAVGFQVCTNSKALSFVPAEECCAWLCFDLLPRFWHSSGLWVFSWVIAKQHIQSVASMHGFCVKQYTLNTAATLSNIPLQRSQRVLLLPK